MDFAFYSGDLVGPRPVYRELGMKALGIGILVVAVIALVVAVVGAVVFG